MPIGIAVFALTLGLIPGAFERPESRRVDVAGAITVTAALMIAVYAVVKGNDVGWLGFQTLGLLALSAALFCAFLLIESRFPAPLVPLRLFRLRNLSTASVVGILWSAAMFGLFFLAAQYLQLVLGYSPLQVGLSFLPANLIMGIFSVGVSAKVVMRFGIKIPTVGGDVADRRRPAAVRARGHRRHVPRRRAARDDRHRLRDRPRVQPGAAGRDERRRAERVGAGVGRREHRVHDGRRARARRARQRGRVAHGQPGELGRGHAAALTGGYHLAFMLGAVFAAAAAGVAAKFLRVERAPAPAEAAAYDSV